MNAIREREQAVTAAVEAYESVTSGDAKWTDAAGSAFGPLVDLRRATSAVVFPERVEPAADALRELEFYSGFWSRSNFCEFFAQLHEQAFVSHPTLASLMRTFMVLDWARGHCQAFAEGANLGPGYADDQIEQLRRRLAGHLRGRPEFEPSASILADVIPALEARIEAATTRHREHARLEEERIAREQAEYQRQVEQVEQGERHDLAEFFARNASRIFEWNGGPIVGKQVAASLNGEASHFFNGEMVPRIGIEAATLLRRRTEAADAVTA